MLASTNPIFSITMKSNEQVLCFNRSGGMVCDKLFIIPNETDSNVTAKIINEQDGENPKVHTFRLEEKAIKA